MKIELELPKEWKQYKLGEVCQFEYGKGLVKGDRDPTGNFDVYGSNGLVGKHSKYLTEEPCIIVGRKGAAGEVHLSLTSCWPIDTTYYIKENEKFVLKYLYYQLKALRLASLETSTAIPGLNRNDAYAETILLPPILEQQKIVQKIEELFSELDKGIENLKLAQQQLRVYRQAVLKSAFEGKLTNDKIKEGELPKGWSWVKITELAASPKNSLKAGPFGSSLKKEFYVNSGYKIYGQEQVIKGNPFYGDYYINAAKYQELNSNKIQPGDVLISLVGTVGKVLVLPDNCEDGIINPRLIKITLDRKKYNPMFFKYYFESSTVKAYYSSKAQGTTMDVLNLGIIKTIPFPICSPSQQDKVIQEIESRLSVCDKIEETINDSLLQAEALKQSILKKAFEGKLVKAEVQAGVDKLVSFKNNIDAEWQRKVLAGKIISSFQRGGYTGRTKLQKILYLCEHHARLDFDTHYIKEAAGPLDSRFLYPFFEEAKQKNWAEETHEGNWYRYEPGEAISELTQDYPKYFRNQSEKIQFIIKQLHDKDTDTCELVATIYAIWNDMIITGSDLHFSVLPDLVYQWSESKAKFTSRKIVQTFDWMKEVGLVPVGFGEIILNH